MSTNFDPKRITERNLLRLLKKPDLLHFSENKG